jgi:hypothetical protein
MLAAILSSCAVIGPARSSPWLVFASISSGRGAGIGGGRTVVLEPAGLNFGDMLMAMDQAPLPIAIDPQTPEKDELIKPTRLIVTASHLERRRRPPVDGRC